MKRLLLLLVFCGAALAQGVRYDIPPVLNAQGKPIANPQITLCTGTSSITGSTCNTPAQSFTDITTGTACSISTPVTLTNSNVCQATGDSLGNGGFWLAQGAYIYCVNAPSTTGKCWNLTVPVGATSTGAIPSLTVTGAVTTGNINGVIEVQPGTSTATIAAALAACPANINGCHIHIPANQVITSGLVWTQNQSPLQIDCGNPSAVNGNSGGTMITYTPAAFSTTGIDAAFFINTLTRVVINNCNFTQGNTVKGPSCALTTIVGNGSVATANFANCTFFKGQMVQIASNTNAGFNGPQAITGVTGTTSFTFVNPTNATGNNGTAQAGVAGIYKKGSQGSTLNNVQIFGFTGAGLMVQDDPNPSSGEYNSFNNFHSRQNLIGVALSQLWVGGGGGSVSGNKFSLCAIAGNTLINAYTSGIASENSFDTCDLSDTTNTLAIINQFGDGVTNCRGPNIAAGTIESTGPAGQIGYKTSCQMGIIDTEGGLNGTTPTITKAFGSGSYVMYKHGGFGVSGFDGSACPASNWWEINLPNYKLDCNGNVGLSSAPLSGATPSINAPGGWALCGGGGCPAQIGSTALIVPTNKTLNLANILMSDVAPTIAAAGCGGGAASIPNNNGTAAFEVNVGTTPGSACTITMPTAAHGWACSAVDVTTNSTSVFYQKQSPAASQNATTVVITNFNDVAAATAFVASDVMRVICNGY